MRTLNKIRERFAALLTARRRRRLGARGHKHEVLALSQHTLNDIGVSRLEIEHGFD